MLKVTSLIQAETSFRESNPIYC